jgi:hypothetical protein
MRCCCHCCKAQQRSATRAYKLVLREVYSHHFKYLCEGCCLVAQAHCCVMQSSQSAEVKLHESMHRSTTVLLTVVLTATTCTGLYTALTLQAGALRPEDSSCSSEHSEQGFAGSLSACGSSVMSAADQSHCLPHIKPLTKVC